MDIRIGRLDVTLTPVDFKTMNADHRDTVDDRRQTIVQFRDCFTKQAKPTPPKLNGWLYTLVVAHPNALVPGPSFESKQASAERFFFRAAGLQRQAKGLSRQLTNQFASYRFTIPYNTLVLGQNIDKTVALITTGQYRIYRMTNIALGLMNTYYLMVPYMVTHRPIYYGQCYSPGFSPYDGGSREATTHVQRFRPVKRDAVRTNQERLRKRIPDRAGRAFEKAEIDTQMAEWLEGLREQ